MAADRRGGRHGARAGCGTGRRQEHRLRLSLLVTALLSFAAACGQSDTASSPSSALKQACAYTVSSSIAVDPDFQSNALTLPAQGGTFSAAVHRTGGSCAWTATADATAEIVGPAGGSGDGTFVFHVLPTSDHFRIGEVDVRWPDGAAVLQYAQAACAFFLVSELEFDANGSTKSFGNELWRECPFRLTASADWVSDLRQDINGNLFATAAANSLHAIRGATITVKTLFGEIRTVTVTQSGS